MKGHNAVSSNAGKYAAGIGGGAASGAAAGAAIGPWGALIGGLIGGGAGAIGTGLQIGNENDQRAALEEEQRRRKKELVIQFLRDRIAREGGSTEGADVQMAQNSLGRQQQQQTDAFNQSTELNPMAFVPIAQAGTQAAGRVYNSLNQPQQQPMQLLPMPNDRDAYEAFKRNGGGY